MTNPFSSHVSSLSGPARDIVPVTPSDTTNLPDAAIGLYVQKSQGRRLCGPGTTIQK